MAKRRDIRSISFGKKSPPKYCNQSVEYNGIRFDSKKEAERFAYLSLLQRAGEITDLQRQVPFELIPTQRESDSVGKRGGIKRGKCIEKSCVYYADFVYKDKGGNIVVEDAKGLKTEVYKIKKKLMLYRHHIRITEF